MNLAHHIVPFLGILVILLAIGRIYVRPEKIYIRFPTIFLCLHILVFYVYNYNLRYDETVWSLILNLHIILTILIIEFYGFIRDKQWRSTLRQ